ncbi:MAG TPA: gamma-glutamyl-gamma-aminobutyrate hydrolase family protein, partial [Myxococcota bacterium]
MLLRDAMLARSTLPTTTSTITPSPIAPSMIAPATTKTPTTTATTSTTIAEVRTPKAAVAGSIGGRVVSTPNALHAVKVAGRDVEVLLPVGTSFDRYVALLEKSGAFAPQQSELDTLKTSTTTAAATTTSHAGDDRRPVVGIVLSEPKMLVPGHHRNTEVLLKLVDEMGCRAVLIPPCADIGIAGGPQQRARAVAALAGMLDGLVGPGGADVDPSIYGETNTHSLHTNVLRDRFEADFVKTALDADLFGFGICRSHQLWNAA